MQKLFYERLMQIMRYLEITSLRGFARKIDISYAKLQSYQRGTSPGIDVLNNILCKLPEISPEWFLTGKGEMLRSINTQILQDGSETPSDLYQSALKEIEELKEELKNKDKQLGDSIRTNLLLLEREKEAANARRDEDAKCADTG